MEIDVNAAEEFPNPCRKLFVRTSPRGSFKGIDSRPKFFPAAENNSRPTQNVPRPQLQTLYSPQNSAAQLYRHPPDDAANFQRQHSIFQNSCLDDHERQLNSLRQENQQLRTSLREKQRMLESLLKQSPSSGKLKNRTQLEALVAKDRQFLDQLRRHNEEFRKEVDTPRSKQQALKHKHLSRDRPEDLRRRMMDYEQRILQYHLEQVELRERMEKQLETINSLSQQKEQYSKVADKLNMDGHLSDILNSSRPFDQLRSEVLFDSTEATLELNAVHQHNARLRKDVNQLVKVLNICHREFAKKEKEVKILSGKVAEFSSTISQLQERLISIETATVMKENHNYNIVECPTSPIAPPEKHFKKKSSECISNGFPSGFWMKPTEEESCIPDAMHNSLYSFGLEEPSVIQLTQNNELREQLQRQLREEIGKHLNLEVSQLGNLLLQFTSKLFFYPDHSELLEFMGPMCQGLRYYEKYEERKDGSVKQIINTFRGNFEELESSNQHETSLEGNL